MCKSSGTSYRVHWWYFTEWLVLRCRTTTGHISLTKCEGQQENLKCVEPQRAACLCGKGPVPPPPGGTTTVGRMETSVGTKKTVAFKTPLPIMHQRPECVGACCFQNTHSDISLGFWVVEGSKAQRNSMQTAQSGKQWQQVYAEKQANVCYNSNLKLEIK